ncbi:hypothetical protein [Limnospira indica]|uniref:hypothetical protein n=1 Tax=Limnospira indica TaxID=147322 RepID=UPI001861B191|nr:hypothetical protein [Limnospira indica]QNH57495.1 MAG: hypothetical protein H2674_26020 [Limnospira indica BM01]
MTIKYGSDFLTVHIDIVWTSRVEIFGLQQLYLRNRFSGTISVRMQKLSQKVSESRGYGIRNWRAIAFTSRRESLSF